MKEQVDHPDHYGGKDNPYEVIKIIEAHGLGFSDGNVIKYLLRAKHKGQELVDLDKMLWYANRYVWNVKKRYKKND